MIVNTFLGTVLWTAYAEASRVIEPQLGHHPIAVATLAGGFAGGAQALVAAPVENIRLLIEGGSGGSSWLHACKAVFHDKRPSSVSRRKDIEDIRQLRRWMKEVGEMAGHGWQGWGWGLCKDICGEQLNN